MVASRRRILWSDEAKTQLKSAYKFIFQDSPQNARRVRDDLIALTRKLPSNPEKYAPDNTSKITMVVIVPSKNTNTELYTGYLKMKSGF